MTKKEHISHHIYVGLMTKKIYLGHAMLQQKRKNNYVGVDKKRKHGNLKREGVEIELKWGRANDARR